MPPGLGPSRVPPAGSGQRPRFVLLSGRRGAGRQGLDRRRGSIRDPVSATPGERVCRAVRSEQGAARPSGKRQAPRGRGAGGFPLGAARGLLPLLLSETNVPRKRRHPRGRVGSGGTAGEPELAAHAGFPAACGALSPDVVHLAAGAGWGSRRSEREPRPSADPHGSCRRPRLPLSACWAARPASLCGAQGLGQTGLPGDVVDTKLSPGGSLSSEPTSPCAAGGGAGGGHAAPRMWPRSGRLPGAAREWRSAGGDLGFPRFPRGEGEQAFHARTLASQWGRRMVKPSFLRGM